MDGYIERCMYGEGHTEAASGSQQPATIFVVIAKASRNSSEAQHASVSHVSKARSSCRSNLTWRSEFPSAVLRVFVATGNGRISRYRGECRPGNVVELTQAYVSMYTQRQTSNPSCSCSLSFNGLFVRLPLMPIVRLS